VIVQIHDYQVINVKYTPKSQKEFQHKEKTPSIKHIEIISKYETKRTM
jgi:hypothetical protein